jgi:hypothetical protein
MDTRKGVSNVGAFLPTWHNGGGGGDVRDTRKGVSDVGALLPTWHSLLGPSPP